MDVPEKTGKVKEAVDVPLKMETVEAELKSWGELMITTAAGDAYESHLGDTVYDYSTRTITPNGPNSQYGIDRACVEAIQTHYRHPGATAAHPEPPASRHPFP